MPPMPLEIKVLTVAFIALLLGAIAMYHVWQDRRRNVHKTVSQPRPAPIRPAPNAGTPPPAAGTATSVPRTGARPRRAPVRRAR